MCMVQGVISFPSTSFKKLKIENNYDKTNGNFYV